MENHSEVVLLTAGKCFLCLNAGYDVSFSFEKISNYLKIAIKVVFPNGENFPGIFSGMLCMRCSKVSEDLVNLLEDPKASSWNIEKALTMFYWSITTDGKPVESIMGAVNGLRKDIKERCGKKIENGDVLPSPTKYIPTDRAILESYNIFITGSELVGVPENKLAHLEENLPPPPKKRRYKPITEPISP